MKARINLLIIVAVVFLVGCTQVTEHREAFMSDPTPEGIPTIVPYLYLNDLPAFMEFTQKGLAAEVSQRTRNDDGVVFYTTLKFNDAAIFAQEADDNFGATPSVIYYYVPDVDAAYQRALDAGAVSIAKPETHYHGDRNAVVKDQWGNQWYFGLNEVDHLTDDEVAERKKAAEQ